MLLVQGGEKLSVKKPSGPVEIELLGATWDSLPGLLGWFIKGSWLQAGCCQSTGFLLCFFQEGVHVAA